MVATVDENLQRYTKREVARAIVARELMTDKLGFASPQATIDIINAGLSNCEVTADDVRRSIAIWGNPIPSIKGKTKKQAPLIAEVSYGPKLTQKQQILHADLMYIKGIAFFVGVLAPLGLVMCVHLVSRTESSIYKAIKRILATGRAEDSPIHHST